MLRKVSVCMLVICALLVFCGNSACLEGVPESKKLTEYFTQSPVVSALFYYTDSTGELVFEELDAARLSELTSKLDSMSLKKHAFHTDYFWGGQFGIELAYEDGGFMTYDGTHAEYRSVSLKDDPEASYDSAAFLQMTDCEFWDVMEGFFTSVEGAGVHSSKY